jgi:hypothetical protein
MDDPMDGTGPDPMDGSSNPNQHAMGAGVIPLPHQLRALGQTRGSAEVGGEDVGVQIDDAQVFIKLVLKVWASRSMDRQPGTNFIHACW